VYNDHTKIFSPDHKAQSSFEAAQQLLDLPVIKFLYHDHDAELFFEQHTRLP
jgi:hypothetical protein